MVDSKGIIEKNIKKKLYRYHVDKVAMKWNFDIKMKCFNRRLMTWSKVFKEPVFTFKTRNKYDESLEIMPVENYFDYLYDIHIIHTDHGQVRKMMQIIKEDGVWMPFEMVYVFNKVCSQCILKRNTKEFRNKICTFFSETTYFNASRGLVELIDMCGKPDGEFKYILYYRDLTTKFCQLRPLKNPVAPEIVAKLFQIFMTCGAPAVLHTPVNKTFTASLINHLKLLMPNVKILIGNQLASRKNEDKIQDLVEKSLMKQSTKHWSINIYHVEYYINTYSTSKQPSIYTMMFKRNPETGLKTRLFNKTCKSILLQLNEEEDLYILPSIKKYVTGPEDELEEDFSVDDETILIEWCAKCGKDSMDSLTCETCGVAMHRACFSTQRIPHCDCCDSFNSQHEHLLQKDCMEIKILALAPMKANSLVRKTFKNAKNNEDTLFLKTVTKDNKIKEQLVDFTSIRTNEPTKTILKTMDKATQTILKSTTTNAVTKTMCRTPTVEASDIISRTPTVEATKALLRITKFKATKTFSRTPKVEASNTISGPTTIETTKIISRTQINKATETPLITPSDEATKTISELTTAEAPKTMSTTPTDEDSSFVLVDTKPTSRTPTVEATKTISRTAPGEANKATLKILTDKTIKLSSIISSDEATETISSTSKDEATKTTSLLTEFPRTFSSKSHTLRVYRRKGDTAISIDTQSANVGKSNKTADDNKIIKANETTDNAKIIATASQLRHTPNILKKPVPVHKDPFVIVSSQEIIHEASKNDAEGRRDLRTPTSTVNILNTRPVNFKTLSAETIKGISPKNIKVLPPKTSSAHQSQSKLVKLDNKSSSSIPKVDEDAELAFKISSADVRFGKCKNEPSNDDDVVIIDSD